jgi:adenylate kinase family enzyme
MWYVTHMNKQAFIFIGRSGCGKGTQAELLMKALQEKDPSHEILYIQTGQEFRKFIAGDTVTEKKAKEIYDVGGLMPAFLTINMWVRPLVDRYNDKQHLVFDGTPRKPDEASILNSIFGFYGIKKPYVINIEISPKVALDRLLARKRVDDVAHEIEKRLKWYETDVVPTLAFFRDNPDYNFLQINGERGIEEIHGDIMSKISNSNF